MSEPGNSKGKQKHNGAAEDKNGSGKKTAKQTPRKRVSQACDTCRSRKDRCDGERPTCSTCLQNGRECSYNANVKKRGLPEGYVRGMEKLWGLAVKEVEDVEDDVLSALGDEEHQRSVWNDENSDNLVEIWRKSQIFTGLERLLSSMTVEPAEGVKRKRANSILKPSRKQGTKDMEMAITPRSQDDMRVDDFMDGVLETSRPLANVPSVTPHQPDTILSPIEVHKKQAVSTSAPSTIIPELPSETWHLLDVYFSYTHSWLPILEKHDVLRISYQYSDNNASSNMSKSADYALLWAVIAYAKFQHRAINNIPRALGSVGLMVWTAERMYAQARTFIPNEEQPLELGHVQALLILTLVNLGIGQLHRSWFLIGQAVRAIIIIFAEQNSNTQPGIRSRSRARHVFLGCFVLDTLVAARMGQKPQLRSSDIELVGLLEEDGLEEWDPWMDCLNVRKFTPGNSRVPAAILSTFNHLVGILRILNEALCTTTLNARASRELVEQLLAWTGKQPSPLQWDIENPEAIQNVPLLPHHFHLHAAFATTLSISRLTEDRAKGLYELASKSARNVADVLNQYSKTFGLLSAPPTFEYYIKTAYDVLATVQDTVNDTQLQIDDWRRNLDYCLEVIEPAWPAMETLRASVSAQSTTARNPTRTDYSSMVASNQIAHSPNFNDSTTRNAQGYGASSLAAVQNNTLSSQVSRPQTLPSTLQRQASSLDKPPVHGRTQNPLNIYENAHATFGVRNPPPPTQSSPRDNLSVAVAQALATAGNTQYNSQLRGSMSVGSDSDIATEPVFSDLMRLDATEWSGNWDQSLVNLGFTDQDNMNQAFYTFCQEPDPLQPNNVFQQLLATSNAEAANYFDNAAFGTMTPNMGIAMTGFEGFGFGDESEGIEAGQILQALAAGEHTPTTRMT